MDKAQFIEMVSREQESLRRFLCVLCRGDAFRADDIAQEALLKAYLSFGKFEGRAKFSTWLFRIAYNCFYDNMAVSKKTEGEPLGPARSRRNPAPGAAARPAAPGTPPRPRPPGRRPHCPGTGMPSGTVRSHLSRAREHLRLFLKNRGNI